MKRFITPFIAVLLLFCASYAAAQTVTFSVGSTTANRGQQICLPIKVSGFNQILGFQFSISYDPSALQFASVKNLNLPDLTEASSFGLPGSGNVPQGKITVLWDEKTFAGLTRPDGTTIFEVCFNVLNSANTTKVEFSNTPTPPDVFNAGGSSLTFNGQAGNVTINGSAATPFKLIASNKSVTQGQQVCVDVTTEGFDSIGTTRYTLQYDTTRLQFVSVGSFNLAGLTNAAFGLPGTTGVPKGRITVNWTNTPATAAGVSRPNGTVIYQVCFTATATGDAVVGFTNAPQAQVVTKGGGSAVTFNGQNGTVSITSGGGNTNTFRLSLADKTAPSGTNVCLDVTAQGYNDILFMQFSLQYDTTKLQFVSVGSFNLSGLDINSFGLPGSGAVPRGRITVSWSDPAVQGVTIPDGTNIFQVCFKILMTTGSSSVNFVASPTPIEIVNGNSQFVTFSSKNGTVTVGTGGGGDPQPGQLRFSISDKTVQSGQQVCVDVTVDNMNDIIGITLGIQYDATRLQFVSVGQFGLPDLTVAQFGTPTSAPPTTAGLVTMVWFDNAVAGVDRPNGSVIFQLCFNAIGANGTTAALSFTGTPTAPMGVDNIDEEAEPFSTKNGTVTIGSSGPAAPTLAVPAITGVNCFGQSTGAINITPQGGSGNFTYRWSNNATTQDLTNIPAGTYSVTVTDATTSLTVTGTYNVNQPAAALNATSNITNIACGAAANSGGITLNVSGGTSPYQYNWSGSLPDNVASQSNLAVGTYAVTITDARSCTFALTNLNVASQSTVQVSNMVPTNINQQGTNGAIAITVTGGTGTYTYAWAGPNNYTSTQKDLSGLTTPGQYCVTVTDAQNCTATRCASITAPLNVTGQANRICDGTTTGSVILTVSGGASPYSFRWSNGATTQNLNNVAAGTYTVTITDSQGGTNTSSFEITKYPPIVLNAQITQASVGGSNGRIVLAISGGTGPYTIRWEDNSTKDTLANLRKDEYCVTVTDSRGCTNSGCYNVTEQNIPLSTANRQITGVTCAGNNDGTLSFQINGGRAPYNIAFSDNTTLSNNNGTVNKNNLSGGKLVYTITDDLGTILRDSVDVPQPAPIQVASVVKHDTEESGCTGSISVTFSGGKQPYSVQWNTPNTGNNTQIINLCEGNFIATVQDANGCRQTFPAIPVTTFRANGAAVATACPQDTTGVIALSITGGTKPYGYSWRNAAGTVISTADTLKNVAPGVYTVSVTEQSGNTLTKQFTIGSNSNLNADVEVISDYNGSDISCPTSTDGIIEATGKSGSGNYSYQWRRGTTVLGTTPVLNGVGAGAYQVAVTDAIGCTVTKQINVVPPDSIQVVANIQQISCAGRTDGRIVLNAVGGAVGKPYSFVWNTTPQEAGPFLLNRGPGTYQVVATDGNNCKVTASFTLAEPKPIQVKVETQPATDGCNGSALAVVEGGSTPYTFRWNAPMSSDAMIDGLCAGTYMVAVTDSRGCTAPSATGIVGESGNPDCLVDKVIITPEGDGANEDFRVTCNESAENHLEIYNRWGQLVFQADNYQSGWEGTTQSGDPLPDGPYYFVLEYTNKDGNLVQQKGSLTILRGK
ncbi:MAG: cohesin domain-containing protein [Saprospiraceae bacterium]